MTTTTLPKARVSRRCENTQAALDIAKGHYPVDFLIALRGDRRRSTKYATCEGALRIAIETTEDLWSHPLDAVYVWVPDPTAPSEDALAGNDTAR